MYAWRRRLGNWFSSKIFKEGEAKKSRGEDVAIEAGLADVPVEAGWDVVTREGVEFWPLVIGFALMTHPTICENPLAPAQARRIVEDWLSYPHVRLVHLSDNVPPLTASFMWCSAGSTGRVCGWPGNFHWRHGSAAAKLTHEHTQDCPEEPDAGDR